MVTKPVFMVVDQAVMSCWDVDGSFNEIWTAESR